MRISQSERSSPTAWAHTAARCQASSAGGHVAQVPVDPRAQEPRPALPTAVLVLLEDLERGGRDATGLADRCSRVGLQPDELLLDADA